MSFTADLGRVWRDLIEAKLLGTGPVMTETETKNPGGKTLKVASTKTLTLKRGVEQGVVRQSFSHGRTKPVVVEKVKRRVIGPGEAKVEVASPAPQAASGRRTAKAASGATAAAAAPAA